MVFYLQQETYSGPISFEVQWNDIWADNVQSCHSSSTALGTRTGYWKPTWRGTDETPLSFLKMIKNTNQEGHIYNVFDSNPKAYGWDFVF